MGDGNGKFMEFLNLAGSHGISIAYFLQGFQDAPRTKCGRHVVLSI